MDNNEVPISIFLDLSFDTLSHKILLNKFKYYGKEGVPLQVFKSYLTNRTQFVEIYDIKSDTLLLCLMAQFWDHHYSKYILIIFQRLVKCFLLYHIQMTPHF